MPAARPEPPGLAAQFPPADPAEWRRLAAAVLRKSGAAEDVDPVAELSTTTYDGLRIRPLYTVEDAVHVPAPGRAPYVRGATADAATTTGWDVRSRLADPEPGRAAAAARTDLETGATSLWLVVGDGGLAIADLADALAGVPLHLAPVVLDAGGASPAAADALLRIVAARGVAVEDVAGNLGGDPIGARARTGCAADLTVVGALAERARAFPRLLPVTVDGLVYADAGAADADEVGIATAVGVAYLRALTDAGADVEAALGSLEFRFAVTADQFLSMAKLRAARRVWDRVAELSGAGPERRGQRQHAVTSRAMMTRRDPWTNLLRTTISCFAAAVGGAAAITVLPFDSAIGIPDDLGRRLARNSSAILHDESSLARVVDPAGGSWYVEQLTDDLAERAWDAFTAIERAGGALAALESGFLAERIDRVRARRADDLAHRRAVITGASEFALAGEAPVRRPAAPAPAPGLLAPHRYAEPYELLRDRADAATAAQGSRPRVLLVALGRRAAHSAEVAFASGLFQAGGLEPIVVAGLPEQVGGVGVACLCGAEDDHANGAAAARALKSAGAEWVWLAGEQHYEDVDGNVFPGCDALAVLNQTFNLLRVP